MTTLGYVLLAIVIYTYLGYPVLVAAVARLFPRHPPARSDWEPKVSICLAVTDGEKYLPAKLESLLAQDYPRERIEIVVYSDGSTDDSAGVVERAAHHDPRIHLLEHWIRRGKPTALNRLVRKASGEVLLMTDVRQPLSPNSVRALVSALSDPEVGCVSGNLELTGFSGAGVYWKYERFIRNAEGRIGNMVGVSGAVYAIRRADFPLLPPDVILDDMFVPLSVELHGKRVVFSESARAFDEAFDDEREFGRKVRTLAGNYQLVAMMPKLLVPFVNRAWLEIVSHKLMRLICPWALVGLLFVSAGLALFPPSSLAPFEVGFWRALAVSQVLFYLLAALGPLAGRLGSIARTFVVLNAAAVVGLWRFARREQAVTW